MKYIFSIMTLMLSFLGSFTTAKAEEASVPNRILVVNTNGNYTGYVIDNLKNIRFARVEGEVLAKIEILDVQLEVVTIAVTRTPACESFRIGLVPQPIASTFNELSAISYVERDGTEPFREDFTNAEVTEMNLVPGADYTLITVAYDEYGVAAGVDMANFTAPGADIVGNPHVDVTFVDSTDTTYTLTFTPNQDVYAYYLCSFEAGTVEQYFAIFGPMMGFASINEMVVGFSMGHYYTSTETLTFEEYDPGTYDVVIVMEDINGNFAPYETYTVSTYMAGGQGEARVNIEIGNYYADDWGDGELVPTLGIYFEPNDQTYRYRAMVYLASVVEQYGLDVVIEDLKSDPPMPGAIGWYQYGDYYDEYGIQPSTPIVILAAGQNADLEWGETTILNYTTPSVCPGYDPTRSSNKEEVKTRSQKKDKVILKGSKAPKLKKTKGIRIHE